MMWKIGKLPLSLLVLAMLVISCHRQEEEKRAEEVQTGNLVARLVWIKGNQAQKTTLLSSRYPAALPVEVQTVRAIVSGYDMTTIQQG